MGRVPLRAAHPEEGGSPPGSCGENPADGLVERMAEDSDIDECSLPTHLQLDSRRVVEPVAADLWRQKHDRDYQDSLPRSCPRW